MGLGRGLRSAGSASLPEVELEAAGVGDELHQGVGMKLAAEEVEVVGEGHVAVLIGQFADRFPGRSDGFFAAKDASTWLKPATRLATWRRQEEMRMELAKGSSGLFRCNFAQFLIAASSAASSGRDVGAKSSADESRIGF